MSQRKHPAISLVPSKFDRIAQMVVLLVSMAWTTAMTEQRHEHFDRDPGWDGQNNRAVKPETIHQDFGWSPGTTNSGGGTGEIGGLITPAAEPAYYAKKFPTRTFNDVLTASGTVKIERGSGHTLIGFFDARTLNEWRTPNNLCPAHPAAR
jgi:hypothetical protein